MKQLFFGFVIVASLVLIFTYPLASLYAHTGTNFSFRSGLFHPVFGPDHVLAMLSVGIISALIGRSAVWRVPVVFVLSMAVGGGLGILNLDLLAMDAGLINFYVSDFLIELMIGLSVVFFGLSIFRVDKIGERVAWVTVFIFGLFHGYAHGMEIPSGAVPIEYVSGFLSGTIGIHVAGLSIGWIAGKSKYLIWMLRASAISIVFCGIYFVIMALD